MAVSGDGRLVVSGGVDGLVKLWDVPRGRLLAALQGHTGPINDVAVSVDGHLAASGSQDGTVRLWDVQGTTCLRMLRGDRRYERMDITGLTGVSEAQKAALLALGAMEART
jgi:WD40 repeat protein